MWIIKYIPCVTKTGKHSPWIWWLFQKIRWPGSLGWIGCTSEVCDFGKLHQQFLGKAGRKMMQASLHLLVISYTGSNVGKTTCWILLDFISKINTWRHSERAISWTCICMTKSPNFLRMWRVQRWTIATSMTFEAFWGHLNTCSLYV